MKIFLQKHFFLLELGSVGNGRLRLCNKALLAKWLWWGGSHLDVGGGGGGGGGQAVRVWQCRDWEIEVM